MNGTATVLGTSAAAAVAVLVLVGAGPTRVEPSVLFSADGTSWSPGIPEPLFDAVVDWVPGDSRTNTFHVSNQSDRKGRVQIFIDSADAEFVRALEVRVNDVDPRSSCAVIEVEAGEAKQINVAVSMATAAGNDTQRSTAQVDVIVQWDNENGADCPPRGAETNGTTEGAEF